VTDNAKIDYVMSFALELNQVIRGLSLAHWCRVHY
jgi:hypothetical protein